LEALIALGGTTLCILILINFKGFSESVINIQRQMWHGGKPLPNYIERPSRLIMLAILLILVGFGLYDAITGLVQQG